MQETVWPSDVCHKVKIQTIFNPLKTKDLAKTRNICQLRLDIVVGFLHIILWKSHTKTRGQR